MKKEKKLNEDDRKLHFMIISKAFDLAKQIVFGFVWIAFAYFIYLAIDSLAGKTTIANIVLKYFIAIAKGSYLDIIPWLLTILFFIWAILEKKLRTRKTKYFQGRIEALEKQLNGNRISSEL